MGDTIAMGSGKRLLFSVSNIFLQLLVLTIAQPELLAHYCNYYDGETYTSNSTFQKNLDTLPSFLTTNASFYNFSIGLNDTVNVIALCRSDVDPDKCRSCLNDSNTQLRELCRREKDSIGWSDDCMLRYSGENIFKTIDTSPYAYVYNSDMAQDVNQFNKVVRTLLDVLQENAARGDSIDKFASGNIGNNSGPNNLKIYGLVQCNPDLSEKQCKDCLNMTFGILPTCCNGKIEGRVLTPSCHFRYANQPFSSLVDLPATRPDSPRKDDGLSPSKGYIFFFA